MKNHLDQLMENILRPQMDEAQRVSSWNELSARIQILAAEETNSVYSGLKSAPQVAWKFATQALFFCNSQSQIVEMNPSFQKLFSVEDGAEVFFLAQTLSHLEYLPISPELDHETIVLRGQIQTPSRLVWCLILFRRVKIVDTGEVLFWGEIQDISRWKETYESLKAAQKEAENANTAKSVFLAHMSHEIRTPMNAIIGMSYLLSKTPLTMEQAEYVEKLGASAKSLLGIINDILDVSKIEAGKMELENREFSLQTMIEDVFNLVRIPAEEKGLRCFCRLKGDIPKYLRGDDLRLKQVLTNLANNAVKFTERGEMVLVVEALGRAEAGSIKLRFSVEDTGIGLDPVDLERVFQPFVQGDSSSTRKFMGTGLGLSISKQLVEKMGGVIAIQSRKGQGTRISVELNFDVTGAQSLISPMAEITTPCSLWFIESNESVRQNIDELLKSCNLSLKIVAGLNEFIQDFPKELTPTDKQKTYFAFIDRTAWSTEKVRNHLNHLKQSLKDLGVKLKIVVFIDFSIATHSTNYKTDIGGDLWIIRPIYPWAFLQKIQEILNNGANLSPGRSRARQWEISYRLEGRRVLLVEDNEVNQLVARDILEKAGAKVLVARHGQEALQTLHDSHDPVNVILLDLQMPIMDGYEFIGKLRFEDRWKDLPVVALTAHALSEERKRCLQLGMNDYLTKPVEPELMIKTLVRWCSPVLESPESPQADSQNETAGEVDWDLALTNAAGNASFLAEILEKFLRDYGSSSSQLRNWLHEGKLVQAQRLLLSLKAVAGYIGANDLRVLSEELENQLRHGTVGAMNQSWLNFDLKLHAVIAEIQRHLKEMIPGILR